ncbi:Alpha,alpha-trehalose-phosphate synthase [UDP-forming] [Granulibacter bethesdensis]|uniref:alpha,alpha-trehalose-phosphate synthase (UDP-forming) n=1 Tax=Granulibacter bethesdensis TaxID=364410 RepID=UPI00090992A4|nr:trehalose-6-phosphate synthase [Granulibacter bethesdensis]APH57570.1 Alpha,alpha-trehalose-phosphate synthase [UDP-forming] [Granulibacter bethesdensis]
MSRLILVSNRVPQPKERGQLAGGLAVALKEAIAGHETLWFGWSGKTVDQPGPDVHLEEAKGVTYATLDLQTDAYEGYYRGFSNGMLWPLLHSRIGLGVFSRSDLSAYMAVNDAFAAALKPLLRQDDIIWIHDYHLIPLGAALRKLGVTARIGFFLHVPFPPMAVYSALPQGDLLLQAFGAYDVIGLQTIEDAGHLNECLAMAGVARRADSYPIGIDPAAFAATARRAQKSPEARRLRESMGDRALILGVDRLDYSKGIPHRFHGYAQLLKRFPEHRNNVTFLQITPVSRGDVAEYRSLRKEMDELVGRINGEHAEFDWVPVRYLTRAVARNVLAGFHREARIGLVTPLRDGMNLVAKEYVAAQDADNPGALILSRFAGAASEMEGAIIINPYDPDEIAEALHMALGLDRESRQGRWKTMMSAVQASTAAAWARSFLQDLENAPA